MHVPLFRPRPDFLRLAGGGFGSIALAAMAAAEDAPRAAASPFLPKTPHFRARAKSVIFLFMEGGPSHVDLFDPKPELTRRHGQPLPVSFGKVITPMGTGGNNLLASKRKFKKYGKSGRDFSDWIPHMATCADDWALLRACQADGLNHVGSVCQMNTGSVLAGRPCLGSWSVFGLGTENRNLPGFVVLSEGGGEVAGGARGRGTLRGGREDQGGVRAEPEGDGRVRPPVPAGPLTGRARRAVRAGVLRGRQPVGRPLGHLGEPHEDVPAVRPADRGPRE